MFDQKVCIYNFLLLVALVVSVPSDAKGFSGWDGDPAVDGTHTLKNESEGEEEKKDGDPVELSTGAFTYSMAGLGFRGAAGALSLDFQYNSNALGYRSRAGRLWSHNYEQEIVLRVERTVHTVKRYPGPIASGPPLVPHGAGTGASPNNLTSGQGGGGPILSVTKYRWAAYHYHDLRIERYENHTNPDITLPSGTEVFVNELLTSRILPDQPLRWDRLPDELGTERLPSQLILRKEDGTILKFTRRSHLSEDPWDWDFEFGWEAVAYSLTEIVSQGGRSTHFGYGSDPDALGGYLGATGAPTSTRLPMPVVKVTTDMGGSLSLNYLGGLLSSVEDHNGAILALTRNAGGNLTGFTRPAIYTDPVEFDAQGALSLQYTREDRITYYQSTSLIETVAAANEVAENPANPTPFLTNFWGGGRKILQQTYGGTNASGVPAGGKYSFIYEDLALPVSAANFYAVSRVQVIDPSGNVTLTYFDAEGRARLIFQPEGQLSHPMPTTSGWAVGVTVDVEPEQYWLNASLVGGRAPMGSNVDSAWGSAAWTKYTRLDYNRFGGIVREETDSVTHRHVFNQHQRIATFAEYGGSSHMKGIVLFEPLYGRTWKVMDPRGEGSFNPPNGSSMAGVNQWERFSTTKTYAYQEMSISSVNSALDAGGFTLEQWAINLEGNVNKQAAVIEWSGLGLSPPPFPMGVGDALGNSDGIVGPLTGNLIRYKKYANAYTDATAANPTFDKHEYVNTTAYNAESQVKRRTDSAGLITEYYYYPKIGGSLDDIQSGSVDFGGALSKVIVGLGLAQERVESYGYDSKFRRSLTINHFGAETASYYDESGRMVASVTHDGAAAILHYDPSGNIIVREVHNSLSYWPTDLPSGVTPPTVENYRTELTYDILNNVVEERVVYEEDGVSKVSTTRRRYNKSRRLVLTLFPDWDPVSNQGNVNSGSLDEWGRIHTDSHGGITSAFASLEGNSEIPEVVNGQLLVDPAGLATTQIFYHKGRNASAIDAEGRTTKYEYNGQGLLWKQHSPEGGYEETKYNGYGLEVQKTLVDASGLVLRDKLQTHDECNRVIQQDHRILAEDNVSPANLSDGILNPGDGLISTRFEYAESGSLHRLITDDAEATTYTHDLFGRVVAATDPLGQITTSTYDSMGNRIHSSRTELSTNPGQSDVVTENWNQYSSTGRLLASVVNSGNNAGEGDATRYYYDQVGNLVLTTDARGGGVASVQLSALDRDGLGAHQGTSVLVKGHGNQTVFHRDARGMQYLTEKYMRVNGRGDGALLSAPDGIISSRSTYTKSGFLHKQIDSKGNETIHEYDDQGRMTAVTYADGSQRTVIMDRLSRPKESTDQNGTHSSYTYGANGKVSTTSITPASTSQVEGATTYIYQYDGGGRLSTAVSIDSNLGPNGTVVVRRKYNSFSGITSEIVNSVVTTAEFDSMGNITGVEYPLDPVTQAHGRATTAIEWERNDPLKRLTATKYKGTTGTPLASYNYLGTLGLQESQFGNGVTQTFGFNLRGTVASTTASLSAPTNIVDLSWTWDEVGNRMTRDNANSIHAAIRSFSYDSASKLIQSNRTDSGSGVFVTDYGIDTVGNRSSVSNGSGFGTYIMSGQEEKVNAYSTIPGYDLGYDLNGNLTTEDVSNSQGDRWLKYDSNNRLTTIEDTLKSQEVQYLYGPLGRRHRKIVTTGSNTEVTQYRYLVTGALAHEVRRVGTIDGPVIDVKEYLYGHSDLAPFMMILKGATDTEHYLVMDDMLNTLAVLDTSGAVLEEFDYADYGVPKDPATWADLTSSSTGVNVLYAGKYFDWESTLYDSKARMYDPTIGRFISRDPLGMWADAVHGGNGYTYAGNNPWSMGDPDGLSSMLNPGWYPNTKGQPGGIAAPSGLSGLSREDLATELGDESDTCVIKRDDRGNLDVCNGGTAEDVLREWVNQRNKDAKSPYKGVAWDQLNFKDKLDAILELKDYTRGEIEIAWKDGRVDYAKELMAGMDTLSGAMSYITLVAMADAFPNPFAMQDVFEKGQKAIVRDETGMSESEVDKLFLAYDIVSIAHGVYKSGRKIRNRFEYSSMKKLRGEEFENYLTDKLGGLGQFRAKGKYAGRQFDGGVGKRWWEAKSGRFWVDQTSTPEGFEHFKQAMRRGKQVSDDNEATYELFSNSPIPDYAKQFLTEIGVPFTEL